MTAKAYFRLYLVTDRPLSKNRPLEWIVEQAVCGGATAVQLREKNCATREFIELALALKRLIGPRGIPLLINDRVDVALATRADGVHLGQGDMPFADARRLLGPKALIGLSVDTQEQALAAGELDAAYLGVSAVFPTRTKNVAGPFWGIEGLRQLRAKSRHTLVGIGGITKENAASVIAAGADGIAVVSAICSADNPRDAAAGLFARVDAALKTGRQP